MHAISRKKLIEFWEANPETKKALQTWLNVAKGSEVEKSGGCPGNRPQGERNRQ